MKQGRMRFYLILSVLALLSFTFPGTVNAAVSFGEEPTPAPLPAEGKEVEPFTDGSYPLEGIPSPIPAQGTSGEEISPTPAAPESALETGTAPVRIPYPWTYENPLRFVQSRATGADVLPEEPAQPEEAVANAQGLQLLSQFGGLPYGVALKDNYAYLVMGSRLVILDVTNPAAPSIVGKTSQWSFNAISVAVSGNYAYVMGDAENGLRIVDVSTPASPKEVGHYASVFGYDMKIVGTEVYVAEPNCLKIIDAATPSAPLLDSVYCVPSMGADSMGFFTAGVAVSGNYAYFAAGLHGLYILDVTNPETPKKVSVYEGGGNLNSVAITADGDFAVLADGGKYDPAKSRTMNSGLRIIDVSNVDTPKSVGFATSAAIAAKVALSGSVALLANGNDYDTQVDISAETGLELFDISNPVAPKSLSSLSLEGVQPFDLAVAGQKAYLVDNGSGLRIIDVSASETPKKVGSYPATTPLNIFQSGKYAYLASGYAGMQIVDMSAPAAPVLVGTFDTGGYTRDVVVSGNTAFLAEGDDGGSSIDPTNVGLLAVNVTNPAAPVTLDFVQTEGEPSGIALQGNTVYLGAGDNGFGSVPPANMGLTLYNVTDLANITKLGFIHTFGNPNGVAVSADGNTAFVASGMYGAAGDADVTGIDVISCADKSNPASLAFFDTPGYAYDVITTGNSVYVADGPQSGLRILDVSTPSSPKEVGSYVSAGASFGVAAAENRVYLADGWNGLQVINVVNPAKPFMEAFYVSGTADFEGAVAVTGGNIYGAAGIGGLFAFQYTGSSSQYSIAGKVTDQNNQPVANVTITAGASYTTKTNANGEYKLENLPSGTYTVTPSTTLVGVMFDPINRVGTVPPSATGVDFKQVPLTNCPNLIKNGDFEADTDWYLPVTRYPAGFSNDLIQEAAAAYSTEEVYAGQRSLRVGIIDPKKNVYSYSSGWQQVAIPANASSATLRFYLYPVSVNGVDPSGDMQLMIVLNSGKKEMERPVNIQSNAKSWTPYQFDLKKYAGKTIWVYFGVVNNGFAANMAMYVDNVSLEACTP